MSPVSISTGSGACDRFPGRVRGILSKVVSEFEVDGASLRGYRSPDTAPVWIRDHTHQLNAAKYFDAAEQLKDPYDFFISRQREDGSFWEWAYQGHPLKRIECEADVEYLMALGALQVWQATGDSDWLRRHVPALERGLGYLMNDPVRWSAEHRLVKRPFTVDTWDFQWMPRVPDDGRYRTKIGPWSRFGIMHGDNSGLYAAASRLSQFLQETDDPDRASHWRAASERIRRQANRLLFNGRYYRHFLHLDPVEVPGVEEEMVLSLSNTFDITRGLCPHEWAVRILDEYAERGRTLSPRPFAPWFTIQPCLPAEGFGNLGHEFGPYRYINGGLMPFVGGELALAALQHGREAFGVDQLNTYVRMVEEANEAWFCYRYDGSPDRYRDSMAPNDGWGASAMLNALVLGLAGVEDDASSFRRVRLSPRWPAAGESCAEVRVSYADGAGVSYREEVDAKALALRLHVDAAQDVERIRCHVLLPHGYAVGSLRVDGKEVRVDDVAVESSRYADFVLEKAQASCEIGMQRLPG